jgi:hypothetical protein
MRNHRTGRRRVGGTSGARARFEDGSVRYLRKQPEDIAQLVAQKWWEGTRARLGREENDARKKRKEALNPRG